MMKMKSKNLLKFGFLPLFIVLLFQVNLVSADEGEVVGPILSDELVSKLIQSCNTEEIFLKAWAPNANMETMPAAEERAIETQLQKEISQILTTCLKKELEEIDCSNISCTPAEINSKTGLLYRLKEHIFTKYFLDDINMWVYETEYGTREAWELYQEKLKTCYKTIFEDCDCDIEGLESLWADLQLNEFNSLEAPVKTDLTKEIKEKIEDCLKTKIAKMTNTWELKRLVFKEGKDEYGNMMLRDNTIYNNYHIAKAILKRLIQLYDLEDFIDLDDEYFNSNCCDHVLFLNYLLSLIDDYHLMDWPELTGRDRQLSADDFRDFLQRIKAVFNDPDAYTLCRKLMFNKLISYGENCDVNKFCQALSCKEHEYGLLFQGEAVEKQLNDSREKEFLDYFKWKLKECSGIDIDLKDFIDFCYKLPTNKTWEELRKTAETIGEEKEIKSDFERIDKLLEEALNETKKEEVIPTTPINKITKGKIRVSPGLIRFKEKEMPIREENKINISLKEKPIRLKVSPKEVSLEEEGIKVVIRLPIEIEGEKTKIGDKELRLTPKDAISKAKVEQPTKIELTKEDKKLVYKIKTTERKRLLFIFPVEIEKEILINAGSVQGEKIEEKKPWWSFLAW